MRRPQIDSSTSFFHTFTLPKWSIYLRNTFTFRDCITFSFHTTSLPPESGIPTVSLPSSSPLPPGKKEKKTRGKEEERNPRSEQKRVSGMREKIVNVVCILCYLIVDTWKSMMQRVCYAILCYAILCYSVLCMLCYAMLPLFMLWPSAQSFHKRNEGDFLSFQNSSLLSFRNFITAKIPFWLLSLSHSSLSFLSLSSSFSFFFGPTLREEKTCSDRMDSDGFKINGRAFSTTEAIFRLPSL